MYRKYFKRAFDTSIAFIVLMIAVPIGIFIAAMIRFNSKGSAILKQDRTGLRGKNFCMYKFRTMVIENNVRDDKQENRLTSIGKYIRAFSLDEIPQLFNILKGDMSIIGPRPWIPEYYQNMTEEQRMRASVRPGISGLAQARGRNNLSIYDKINYDLLYVKDITFVNDIKIIILTVMALFEKSGAAIEKFGIHQEIESLRLQHRVMASASAPAFFAELPKAGKPVDRISRPGKKTPVKPKKVLFTATVDSHILAFHLPYLKYFKDNGYEVHVATSGTKEIPYADVKHTVSFERSPLKPGNIKAILSLKKIIDREKFYIIHTHTPMGSVVTRLAAIKARKKYGTRVIYTAHGFHFFKGAPALNWIIFYPIEKTLARFTDTLITINQEDYKLASKKFKTNVRYVPGVGVDPLKFESDISEVEKSTLRKTMKITDDDFAIIYIAELIPRKNHVMAISSMEELVINNPDIHLLIVGKDSMKGELQKIVIKSGLESNIHFLGFRKDIADLCRISDLAVTTSKQEGFGIGAMEALASGLPVVGTRIRGHTEFDGLIKFVEVGDIEALTDAILEVKGNKQRENIKLPKKFQLEGALQYHRAIYEK